MTASPWLDAHEAAAYTKASEPTILRAARRGALRAYKVGGKKMWRFRTEDLDEWVMKSSTPAPFVLADSRQRGAA